MVEEIIENRMIESFARHFQEPMNRINKIHESDAELVDPGSGSEYYIAVTTDAVIEEVASGLYDDPYLIGWMLATVNFSDLAAVGAYPLGLVVCINTPSTEDDAFIQGLSTGISDACQQLGSFVLGGDTNQSSELYLSGCAVGTVPKRSTITRKGAKSGDRCYLTGPAGLGGLFAFLKLSGKEVKSSIYRPVARIEEGKIIRQFANCCMDTSDGVIHTVDTLMRVNDCRFILNDDWGQTIHPDVLNICQAQNLPPWITMAGVHGEFELLFTIHKENEPKMLREAEKIDWSPVYIGEVDEGKGVYIRSDEQFIPIDSGHIRNLSENAGSDHQAYIAALLKMAGRVDI